MTNPQDVGRPLPSIEQITQELLAARRGLLETPPARAGGRIWLARHSEVIDRALQDIFAVAVAESGQSSGQGRPPVALVAAGGYGRRELAPYSDIDLAFVPAEEDDPAADALIKIAFRRLIEVLMDGARLEVGYAFRPITDLDGLDHAARTALLDGRAIAGDLEIARRLRRELLSRFDLVSLLQEWAVHRERQSRDPRRCLYSVEPDLKTGVGGLRDMQSAVWLLQVHHGAADGDSLRALANSDVVSADVAAAVAEAGEFVWQLRNWLHLTARRRQDVFSREHQEAAAAELGAAAGARTTSDFLEAYYRRAEVIARFADRVAATLLNGELRVGDGFVARGRQLFALPGALEESRSRLLSAAEHAQRCGLELSAELAAEIAAQAPQIDERVRHSPRAAASFLALLREGDAEEWLRRLHELGVLERYLPELGAVMRLAPSDPGHVFTVGEHGIRVAGWLARLIARPPAAPDLLSHALSQVTDAEVLVLAGLLHDAGKLAEDEEHAVAGERIARSVGERLGLGSARVGALGLLVREHLLLSLTSRLRDTRDPATIAEVMQRVDDRETLGTLYLLSQADLRNVSPTTNIAVELRLLDDLYSQALALSAEPPLPAEAVRSDIARQLNGAPQRALHRLVERMPPRYLLNTPLPEIAGDVEMFDRLEREEPVIEIQQSAGAELTEVIVCVHDDPVPGLLHKITGTLFAHDLDIHTAQVFTTEEERPVALDRLWVSRRRAALTDAQAERLERDLRSVLLGEAEVDGLLIASGKSPGGALSLERVHARNDVSDEHTVIEVEAADAPGLLFRLTHALSDLGLDIHTAKVTTWGGRAVDAFYVTRRGAGKSEDSELPEVESALAGRLSAGERS